MRTARVHAYGERPRVEEVPDPVPGPGEVLVRVRAAALNPLDGALLAGAMAQRFPLPFPYTLGTDLAGAVERVGDGVTAWAPGDDVIARFEPSTGGALAELAVMAADRCVARPPALTPVEGAGIPTAAGTAWAALFETAGLKAGQSVLVHAGAGGVGSFAVQFAKAAGARVFATASGDGVTIVRGLGADQVVDHKAEDFADVVSDMDVVLVTVRGDAQERSWDVLRPGGWLVSIVAPPDEAAARAHGVSATMLSAGAFLSPGRGGLRTVVEAVGAGKAKVLIDRVLPLEQVAEALDRQMGGHARGKIVLTVG